MFLILLISGLSAAIMGVLSGSIPSSVRVKMLTCYGAFLVVTSLILLNAGNVVTASELPGLLSIKSVFSPAGYVAWFSGMLCLSRASAKFIFFGR